MNPVLDGALPWENHLRRHPRFLLTVPIPQTLSLLLNVSLDLCGRKAQPEHPRGHTGAEGSEAQASLPAVGGGGEREGAGAQGLGLRGPLPPPPAVPFWGLTRGPCIPQALSLILAHPPLSTSEQMREQLCCSTRGH